MVETDSGDGMLGVKCAVRFENFSEELDRE